MFGKHVVQLHVGLGKFEWPLSKYQGLVEVEYKCYSISFELSGIIRQVVSLGRAAVTADIHSNHPGPEGSVSVLVVTQNLSLEFVLGSERPGVDWQHLLMLDVGNAH